MDREAAKAIVRRNTEEVQGTGDWALFDRLFADSFHDHTPPLGMGNDKAAVLQLYQATRAAFPDWRADIHWQLEDEGIVTTYKTYYGTHLGDFRGLPPTGKPVKFISVDAMKVVNGQITDHWGLADSMAVFHQLGLLGG